VREEVDRKGAEGRFKDDPLKLERLSELKDDETISVYTDGPFVDLCRGPHVPSTGRIKHFKLLHAAGAYWRGDSRRQMLQRIYGTAWFKKEDLAQYLHRLEEAAKRDHRKVGKELDLFMFHHWAPGAVFWTRRGTAIVNELYKYLTDLHGDDYHEVKTPLMYNKALWEQSGHWGSTRRTCSWCWIRRPRSTTSPEAHELPVALPLVQLGKAQLSRTAAPLEHVRRAAPE